jgi:hypothetical protein
VVGVGAVVVGVVLGAGGVVAVWVFEVEVVAGAVSCVAVLVVGVGVVAVVATGHSERASAATACAPDDSLDPSRESTPDREPAEPVSFEMSLATATQSRADRAEDTEFNWLLSVLAWPADRRPPLLPHAASSATAKPRRPARIARGA